MTLARQLLNDEAGFVVSAELVLIATIAVLGLIVGLSEVALNINNELEDVGTAFACLQQTYDVAGSRGHKGRTSGSSFDDNVDFCDGEYNVR
jgi:hypothetical protein